MPGSGRSSPRKSSTTRRWGRQFIDDRLLEMGLAVGVYGHSMNTVYVDCRRRLMLCHCRRRLLCLMVRHRKTAALSSLSRTEGYGRARDGYSLRLRGLPGNVRGGAGLDRVELSFKSSHGMIQVLGRVLLDDHLLQVLRALPFRLAGASSVDLVDGRCRRRRYLPCNLRSERPNHRAGSR